MSQQMKRQISDIAPELGPGPNAPRVLASKYAQDRIAALTNPTEFMAPQEWNLDFENLKELIAEQRRDVFSAFKKSGHAAIREDIAAEAGFLLGLEMGKRMAGGAR